MKKYCLLFILPGLLLTALAWASPGQAISSWSEPLQLNDEGAVTPFVLADASGGIHVFWGSNGSQGSNGAIFYRQLTDGRWSETVDIIAPPIGNSAIYPRAVIDAQGFIHLVWVSDKLYYSQAHVSEALDPRGWSTPYQMTNYGVTNGSIQLGMDGSLTVLFGSKGSNPAVYSLTSDSHGDFWRIAVLVSAPQNGAYTLTSSLVVDTHGRMHATWIQAFQPTLGAEGGMNISPAGVYYARSDDGGVRWSYPQTVGLGEQSHLVIGVDALDSVHLFWSSSSNQAGIYHTVLDQQSGEWRKIERILPDSEAVRNSPALALDSSGRLHVAFSSGGPLALAEASTNQITFLSWYGGRWSDAYQDTVGLMDSQTAFTEPALAISQGDTLHLVWSEIPVDEAQQSGSSSSLWYSVRQLSSTHIDPQPIPGLVVPVVTATIASQSTLISLTPTPWVVAASGILPSTPIWYKQVPVIFGATITLLLLIIILTSHIRKQNHAR